VKNILIIDSQRKHIEENPLFGRKEKSKIIECYTIDNITMIIDDIDNT